MGSCRGHALMVRILLRVRGEYSFILILEKDPLIFCQSFLTLFIRLPASVPSRCSHSSAIQHLNYTSVALHVHGEHGKIPWARRKVNMSLVGSGVEVARHLQRDSDFEPYIH